MGREAILTEIAHKIGILDDITTTTRKPITTAKELNEIAHPQFPVVNVIGGLPGPSGGRPIELAEESYDSAIRSEMSVFIRVFGYNKVNPDTEISTLFNLIYQNLYYDPTLKGYDYTDKNVDAVVDTDVVIYRTETELAGDDTNFQLMKSLTDLGLVNDLTTLDYDNPALFTDVTDITTSKAYSTSVQPSAITEYRDPYFIFTIIMNVAYNHKSYSI